MCSPTRTAGGLHEPADILQLRNFIRTLKVERQVRGKLYGACARVEIGSPNAAPEFRLACIQAMASASDVYGTGDEQRLLEVSDIQALAGKHMPHALAAEELILQADEIFKNVEAAGEDAQCLLYLLRLRCVHHVFRKEDSTRGVFKTLASIGHQFCTELAAVLKRPVPSPWQGVVTSTRAAEEPKKAGMRGGAMVEFASSKVANACDLLLAEGVAVGRFLKRTSDGARLQVLELGSTVKLEDELGAHVHVRHECILQKNLQAFGRRARDRAASKLDHQRGAH